MNRLKSVITLVSLLAVTVGLFPAEASARSSRVGQLPNGSSFSCANCHVNPGGGGTRNAFGLAVENGFLNGSGGSATLNWNATLAAADSDGDGVANGVEVGDADGDGTPDAGVTVTNPGDATSFNVQQPPVVDPPTSPDVTVGDLLVLVGDAELIADAPNTPLEPGVHEFQIVFGAEINSEVVDGELRTRNLGLRIRPNRIAEENITEERVSADRRSLFVSIDLPADTVFELIIGSYPGNPENPATSYFIGTTELPTGAISGLVTVSEELDPIVGGLVTLFSADVIDVLMTDGDAGPFIVNQVRLTSDLGYRLRFLADGDYVLLARGLREGERDPEADQGDEDGRDGEGDPVAGGPRPLRAFYDADEDGVPDIVSVSGEEIVGIDITIQPPPVPTPIQIQSMVYADQTIEEGVSNASVPAGPQTFVITFDRALGERRTDDGDLDIPFDIDVVPAVGDDDGPDLTLSEDRMQITGTLDLPADASFQLTFGPRRVGSEYRQNFYFGTVDLPAGSVSGALALPEGIDAIPDRSAGIVVLVSVEALAEVRSELTGELLGDAAGKQAVLAQLVEDGDEMMPEDEDPDLQINQVERQAIRVAVPNLDLGFDLQFVPAGTYLIGSSVETVGPDGRPRRLVGFYDPEGTGTPAEVTVAGDAVTGLTLAMAAPAPPPARIQLGDVLARLFPRFESGELEFVDIREFLPGLNEEDRRRLRTIAGEDGLLAVEEIRRVLGVPQPAMPPVVSGRVTNIDETESLFTLEDAQGEEWTILVGSDTQVEIEGDQNALDGSQPRDGVMQPMATKQGQGNQPGNGNGNSGGGNPGGGNAGGGNTGNMGNGNMGGGSPNLGPQRKSGLGDVVDGVEVAVFGEIVDDLTVDATRIIIRGGGIVRITFAAEGEIAFFDPFSLVIEMKNKQTIEVTRNTMLTGPEGESREPGDLLPGTRISITGFEAKQGRKTTLVAEAVQILGGRPFRIQGTVAMVVDRTLTIQPRAPEPIDPRAQFGDARGRRVPVEVFQGLLADADGLQLLVKFNRYGSGIVGLQIFDPRQKKPVKEDERLVDITTVSVDEVDAGLALVFRAPPPILVPEGTPIRGDADAAADLADLVDKRVIIDGEVTDEGPSAVGILVIRTLERIDVAVEVGDADGQGVDNDATIRVLDSNGAEIENAIQLSLDRERPVDVLSGDTKLNLRPGKHKVQVRIPELPGLVGEATFIIRDKGPGLEVTETFPADGDVGVPESTEVAISFSSSIQELGQFVNVVAFLRPGPNSGRLRGFELSDDGRTIYLPVELELETTYTLQIVSAVSSDRQAIRRPINVTFSTGGTVETPGSVSGSVGLVARAKQVDAIEILSGEVIAVDSSDKQAGRGAVEVDGTFEIAGLGAGTYQLFASLETSAGSSSGFLDEGADGIPDEVTVASGQVVTGLSLGILEPLVLEETVVTDVLISPVTLDLDAAAGDQGLDFVAGEPGSELDIAVYLTGAVDLLGFDLLLEFDPTALTFIEVLEDGEADEDLNLMKEGGGFALGITSPSTNSINWSVAILGPTDEQLGQGDGLIGVFRFAVNESFFGATDVSISQLVQESVGGATVIQPFVSVQIEGEGVTSQIAASASDASISADGGQTTISAELQDLDGFVFSDDSASELTFEIESGTATVNGETSVVLAVSAGTASVSLEAQGSGTIGVRITASGASSVLVEVEAPGLGEGEVGPIALDANSEAGDQAERVLPGTFSTGDQVSIDIAGLSGADGQIGFQVRLAFDPLQLEFTDFVGADLMATAVPITNVISDGVVELNAAILGGQSSGDSGSLGTATFTVLEGFSGQSQIELISGAYTEELSIGFGGAILQVGGSAPSSGGGTADFDGDGSVGFNDFIAFAGAFGSTTTSEGWDPKFDLDSDGAVGFGDFIAFAGVFGQTVKPALSKPLGSHLPMNQDAQLTMVMVPGSLSDDLIVRVNLETAEAVQGFGFRVGFDTDALEFRSARTSDGSMFAESGTPALIVSVADGAMLADLRSGDAIENGTLIELHFGILDETASSSIEILDAMVSDPRGGIASLAGARLAGIRALPSEFGLNQNFPNPFNPETQIAFQIPQAGDLSLVVYNTLGQQVRVLEQGVVEAGFHSVVWDGKDSLGKSVSSGVYLIRMRAASFKSIKKMLLLK